MVKNFATFQADFPDDAIENEQGDIVVPAGRALIGAIAGNVPHSSEPEQHSHYGWTFEFRCPSGLRAWALLQCPDGFLLMVEPRLGLFRWGRRKEAAYELAIDIIHAAVAEVPGLTELKWMTPKEFNHIPNAGRLSAE